jgi:hypothetical protein
MTLKFEPKIGQLVSWKMSGPNMLDDQPHLGIVTELVSEHFVQVTFLHHDWIITLNIKGLTLVNDVADGE